jgi:hypothetical protein
MDGKLDIPVTRTVRLTQAIDALTELERTRTPKGGKLVIVPRNDSVQPTGSGIAS